MATWPPNDLDREPDVIGSLVEEVVVTLDQLREHQRRDLAAGDRPPDHGHVLPMVVAVPMAVAVIGWVAVVVPEGACSPTGAISTSWPARASGMKTTSAPMSPPMSSITAPRPARGSPVSQASGSRGWAHPAEAGPGTVEGRPPGRPR